MRKSLQDLAYYMKEIMVPEMHQAYTINPIYTEYADEEYILEGVLRFRSFLVQLYDALHKNGHVYDNCKKVAHEYENRTTLINIGYHGI